MKKELFMDKEKHLEMIQNIITRMANCSFLIKGWTITLIAAVFVLAAKDTDIKYIIITYIIIPTFWFLDGYYLSQERKYRALYDKVRELSDTDYSMDTSSFDEGKNTWIRSVFSKTVCGLYIPLIVLVLIIMFIFPLI